MEIYPSGYLPSPLFDYSGETEQTSEIIEFDAGNKRHIRKSSNIREVYTLRFIYSNDQIEFFRGWHKHKISQGADTFLMDLMINDVYDRFQVTIEEGRYISNRASDDHWEVTFKIFIEDTHIISEQDLDAILNA